MGQGWSVGVRNGRKADSASAHSTEVLLKSVRKPVRCDDGFKGDFYTGSRKWICRGIQNW